MKYQWKTRILNFPLIIISIPLIFLGSEISANASHHLESNDPNNPVFTNRNSITEPQHENIFLQVDEVNLLDSFDSIPSNDDRENATAVNNFPFTDIVDTTFATSEEGEIFDCGLDVGKSVWYEYSPEADVNFIIDTIGSNFDTVIEYFEGVNIGDEWVYFYGDCNDDFNGLQSQLNISGIIGTTYLIAIGGKSQASGSMSFNLHPPTIDRDTTCEDIDAIPQAECLVLEDFFNQTGGPTWYNSTGWFVNNEVCTWYGIVCNGEHIDQINLAHNNLTGSLTTDFTNLSNLAWLQIPDNNLSGDFSTIIEQLPHSLILLWLPGNNFSGMITSSISDFTNLSALGLHWNQLTGDLSATASFLPTSLSHLDLGENDLGGDLSTIINNLPIGLSDLYLHGNNFTGTIPDAISTFSYLSYFSVAGNPALAGTIPLSITNLDYMYLFDFSNTNLCEPIDPAYTAWKISVLDYIPGPCVSIGTELLTNTSFETFIPVGWQDGRQIEPTEGPDCGSGFEHTGNCAWRFNGDGTNKRVFMRFKLFGSAGDKLDLSIYRRALSVPEDGGAFVKATLFYTDGTKEVFRMKLDQGTMSNWEQISTSFIASKSYKRINLDLFYKKASGTMWLDDIELIRHNIAMPIDNTSFERYKPDEWVVDKEIVHDGPDCGAGNAHSGNCAWRFEGDGRSKRLLMRVKHNGVSGDPLTIRIYRKGLNIPTAAGAFVKVEIFYTDGTSDILKLDLDVGNLAVWEEIITNFTAAKDYKRFNIDLFYKKAGGTLWLDDISLLVP